MIKDFLNGICYLLAGFKLIFHSRLSRFVWIPLLINIVLFLLLLIFTIHWFGQFSHWVEHLLPVWLQWLHWFIWVGSVLISLVILAYVSTLIVNTIGGPFNSILSKKVELQLVTAPSKEKHPRSVILEIFAAIRRELQLLGYYLPRAIFYLILFVIPIVQIVAAITWFLFNGWVLTIQYLDYPMDNHQIPVAQMRKLMSENRWMNLGFGSAVMLFTMIPLVNFLIMPVAVAGATAMWVKEYRPIRA
jgi:CysZ protein